jgi:hypothetical protein
VGLGASRRNSHHASALELIDDSSIWTQNWPWTPVPPVGKYTCSFR